MKKAIVVLVVVALAFAATVWAGEAEIFSLEKAVRAALERNTAARLAEVCMKRGEAAHDLILYMLDRTYYQAQVMGPTTLTPEQIKLTYTGTTDAEHVMKQAEIADKLMKNQLALEAQVNYVELVKARENEELARLKLERAREQLRLVEAAYNAGMVAKSDVMGAETQVAMAEAQVYAAESAVRVAEAALNKTLGRDLLAPLETENLLKLPEVGPVDYEKGLAGALEKRLELVNARHNTWKKEWDLNYIRYNYTTYIEVRDAELELEEAELQLKQLEENIALEIYRLYTTLSGIEQQLSTLEKSLEMARESYRLAKVRYENGLGTQSEVTAAMVNLSELETQLMHARYDQYLAYLQWQFATGEMLYE